MGKQLLRRGIAHMLSILMIMGSIGAGITAFGVMTPEVYADSTAKIQYNSSTSGTNANAWDGSDAQTWCENFYNATFNEAEQNAILDAKVDEGDEDYEVQGSSQPRPGGTSSVSFSPSSLQAGDGKDKVFFLSAKELSNVNGSYRAYTHNGTSRSSASSSWWLRSPIADSDNRAGYINDGGNLTRGQNDNSNVTNSYCARPAFYLDLTSGISASKSTSDRRTEWTIGNDGEENISGMEVGDYVNMGTCVPEEYTGYPYWRVISVDEDKSCALLMSEYLWTGDGQHSLIVHEAVSAKCTEEGNNEYWECEYCGKYFSDAEGKMEIEEGSWITSAIGHNYGKWIPFDESQHQKVCANDDSHVEKANHKWNAGVETKPATEDKEGVMAYTCTTCGATKTEAIAKLAVYSKLQLKSSKQTKESVTLTWKKVSGATKYVIYGNKCGKNNKKEKLATSTGKTMTFKEVAGKKVKEGTYYKFIVVALDKNNNVVSTSKAIHVATKGGKVTNAKKVTVKKGKKTVSKVTVKKGKTVKVRSKVTKAVKKLTINTHRRVKYESSNKKIATVTEDGKIKGVKKGTCYIYAYAQNGVMKKIKVVVK